MRGVGDKITAREIPVEARVPAEVSSESIANDIIVPLFESLQGVEATEQKNVLPAGWRKKGNRIYPSAEVLNSLRKTFPRTEFSDDFHFR